MKRREKNTGRAIFKHPMLYCNIEDMEDSICVVNVMNASFYHLVIIWSTKERKSFWYFFLSLSFCVHFGFLFVFYCSIENESLWLLRNGIRYDFDCITITASTKITLECQWHCINREDEQKVKNKIIIIQESRESTTLKFKIRNSFVDGFMTVRSFTFSSATKWFFCCSVQIIIFGSIDCTNTTIEQKIFCACR